MTIDRPQESQIHQLRSLWKEAFADPDDFLDVFFRQAFSPDRCRCVTASGRITAALYWFDCVWGSKRLAYLYAVATDKACRGQGLCRALVENTHCHLRSMGYDGCVLVPREDSLFTMYSKFGYRVFSHVQVFTCAASGEPLPLKPAAPEEYASARRRLLPENSVLQEGVTLDFLSAYGWLYTGPACALAAYPDGKKLIVCELLGAPQSAPQILSALGFAEGSFRIPGRETPFAMYRSLTGDASMPDYFGLALD